MEIPLPLPESNTILNFLKSLNPDHARYKQPTPRRGAVATIEVLDVGQGDAILIRSPEGKTALIDAGPSRHVVELLKVRGVERIDLVVVSHHHADHYGGMAAVIREFRPRVFLASGSGHTTTHYLALLELVRERGIQAIGPTDRPRRIELGSVVLTVFPQPAEDRAEENNNSVGIRLQYGAFSVLLPGDAELAERIGWEQWVPTLCSRCTVLKLAHHGSNNGTDARWLDLVRPELAVASVGRGNIFGHPSPQTIAMLARRGILLLRTDRDRTVTIESDGHEWRVVGHKIAARGPPQKARARPDRSEKPRPVPAGRLNVNTASQAELEALPGIGPVLARRIVEGRPYRSVEELERVEGIGKKRLGKIRPLVTAE
jgi:beta-lactamase superfamily II metal-dependent hydrolase